jgi:hypothetical protein
MRLVFPLCGKWTVFYTSGNRFVRHTGTFGNLIFSFVPSDNRKTRSTCLTLVFTIKTKVKHQIKTPLLYHLSFLHMKFKDIDKIKVAISEVL